MVFHQSYVTIFAYIDQSLAIVFSFTVILLRIGYFFA